jgi:4-aminobutyrate aminotransferase/4-aminobutyrate aminotransferase/(S)-3-amino-2-methylpropionate transaminase
VSGLERTASAEELLAAKARYLLPCVYHFYQRPPVIVAGKGAYLFDREGKRYLDCYSGVTVMNAGHGNPMVLSAVREQLERLQHTTTIYLTEPMYQLAERLAWLAPGPLQRTFFCASGSEANEAAMLLASLATGRRKFLALQDALHGRTKWAMSATGLSMWRTDDHLVADVHFVPHPCCHRCPLEKRHPECDIACAEVLERRIEEVGADRIAALIAEPIQGNGGIVVPPAGYWQRVREICDRHGILLIFDEVQTAMNRTGRWFACEHWETTPDIITMAKALGNGLPIAAMITNDTIASAYTRPGASTFGANPVSCAAALATIAFHQEESLGAKSAETGDRLRAGLASVAEKSPYFDHVRGKGLMIGIDVVDATGAPDAQRCDDYLESLKDAGFLVGKTGAHRNVLTFMPPLILTARQAAEITEVVADL